VASTLKSIAERVGVSVRTVSRALKAQYGITDSRRTEILSVAAEMGYVPNIVARNLRLQMKNYIGIVTATGNNEVHNRKNFDLQKRLEERGYFPLLGILPENHCDLRKMLLEWSGMVDSVIFFNWRKGHSSALKGLPQQFIFVDCGEEEISESFCHRIVIDRASGICDAILCLLKSGCNKFMRCGNLVSRQAGIEQAFKTFKGRGGVSKEYIQTNGIEFNDGYELGKQVIDSKADAVFFDTDRMAFGFLRYAWERQIQIPGKIAVVGFDDDVWCSYSCPALSSVAHPIEAINKKIIEFIERHPETSETVVFKTSFVGRLSSR
jgi:DNA-binding LacI/PurR family transcriptional regulator